MDRFPGRGRGDPVCVAAKQAGAGFFRGQRRHEKIASAIRSGANAYLSHQYATVAKVFVVVFILLLVMAFGTGGAMLSKFTPFAFLTGGICPCWPVWWG